jgi:hypothetical protein
MAALPCLGHGNLSFEGIVAGKVVVVVDVGTVVVVVVPGRVVVVVPGSVVVVVVVVSLAVDEFAMSGVTSTKEATSTTLREKISKRPRRNNGRGDNFTHLPYFARHDVFVTEP